MASLVEVGVWLLTLSVQLRRVPGGPDVGTTGELVTTMNPSRVTFGRYTYGTMYGELSVMTSPKSPENQMPGMQGDRCKVCPSQRRWIRDIPGGKR